MTGKQSQSSKAREFQKNICFIDYTKTFDCVDHNKLWKILQETGIPDHLTCLLRNLYAGQEATVRTGHGTMDWFQIGKGVHQGCILLPCLFNFCAEYIIWNVRLDLKRQRNQRSNCQNPLDHWKSKRVPEKHLLLFYWLHQNLWLCGSQQTVENSSRDGNTRPCDLPPEKSVCRSRSNC